MRLIVLALAMLLVFGSTGKSMSKSIEEVLKEHTEELMRIPGVVGTALGSCAGHPCIKVYVTEKSAVITEKVPPSIDGYPVGIEETGEFKAVGKKKK
jgi:hypothetical protein